MLFAFTVTFEKLPAKLIHALFGARVAVMGQMLTADVRSTSVHILIVWSVSATDGIKIFIRLIGAGVVSKTARLQGSRMVTLNGLVMVYVSKTAVRIMLLTL